MLFSNEDIADLINEKFEAVWVSLRPVPRITLDFGDGKIIKRTLHGNIATWICSSDGAALDVLPGIYDAKNYQAGLLKLEAFHNRFSKLDTNEQRRAALEGYHASGMKAESIDRSTRPDATDGQFDSYLVRDTKWNESVRRTAIHRYLKECGLVQPDQVTKWMYRELLHADLDDPWLGLGDALFGNYPFVEEDAS